MSLAELFGIKETWRERMRLVRHWSFVNRRSKPQHAALHTQPFILEPLEPRVLLSAATIVPEELIQETQFNGPVESINTEPLVVLDQIGDVGGGFGLSESNLEPQAPPAEPTSVAAVDRPNDAGGAINLTWTPSASGGVTEQRIYRSTTSGSGYALIQTITNNTTTSYTDTGLTNGTTYFYVITAFNVDGESVNSNETSATPSIQIAVTKTWDGGGGNSDWATANNWSDNIAPISTDIVSVPTGVTVTSGSPVTIAGLFGRGNLTVSSSFSITGTAALDGTLTISGGAVVVNSPGTLRVSNLVLSSGSLTGSGNVTLTGSGSTWTGGSMAGTGTTTVASSGSLSITGSITLSGRTLSNAGTVNWSGTQLGLTAGAMVNNTGIFNASATQLMNLGTGTSTFTNAGLFTKSGTGTTTTIFNVAFVNQAGGMVQFTAEAAAPRLLLQGGGASTGGTFDVSNGTLEFNEDTYTLGAATTVTGTSGTVRFSGTNSTTISGGYTLTGTATTNTTGGTVTFDTLSSSTAGFIMTGGTLTGSGTVIITGSSAIWAGGTMRGTGTTRIAATTGALTLQGAGTKNMDAGRVLEVRGTATWTGGTFELNATGTAIGSGRIDIVSGGLFEAQATTTLQASTFGDIATAPLPIVTNAGTFTKSGTGTTTTISNVAFVNAVGGTVQVQSGTLILGSAVTNSGTLNPTGGVLSLTGGGSGDGTFKATSLGILRFAASYTFTNVLTTRFEGTGTIDFFSGTFTVPILSTYDVSGDTQVSGATVTLSGTVTNIGNLKVSSGTLTLNSAVSATSLVLSGGTLQGPGTLTVSGATTWSGGTITGAGTLQAQGGLNLSGAANKILSGGRVLEHSGTGGWTGAGSFQLNTGGGTLRLVAGSLFESVGTQSSNAGGGFLLLDIQAGATWRKSGGGATTITAGSGTLTVQGSLDVVNGTLQLDGEGTSTGTATIASGGTLILGGGSSNPQTFGGSVTGAGILAKATAGTTVLTGPVTVGGTTATAGTLQITSTGASLGAVTISGGTLQLAGPAIAASLTQSGGTLSATGTLTVAGEGVWTAGTMTGAGTTSVLGGLTISGVTSKLLGGGRVLALSGTSSWTGANALSATNSGIGTLRLVSGTFTVGDASGQNTNANGTGTLALEIQAGATLRKSLGGTTNFAAGVTSFTNAGMVEVLSGTLNIGSSGYQQTSGLTSLTGGSLTVSGTLTLAGGSLTGTGTVTATTVSNIGGQVGPGLSPGTLTISGNYIQGSTGTLNIEVGGTTVGAEYDRLAITGAATLNGTLNVSLINDFVPLVGTSFTIMTFGSRSGDFTTKVIAPGLKADVPGATSYTLSGATYQVTNTNDSGAGSLRQAILDASINPGLDLIAFNIAGAGVHTITPLTALPNITDAVIIDGYTQPGSSPNTLSTGNNATILIELDGTNITANSGLFITAGNSTVRGLAINRFGIQGITLEDGDNNLIEGNFIGTDPTGTIDRGNIREGILIWSGSADNQIGGTTPAARNLLSGNNLSGIQILNNTIGVTDNLVQGNYIGTNASGTAVLSNGTSGILINDSPTNTIGGTTPGAGNLISGNSDQGVMFFAAGATNNIVQGNFIGTNAAGMAALGNGDMGVLLVGGTLNIVGGTTVAARNVIAGNLGWGVTVGGADHLVQGNYIGVGVDGTTALGNQIGGLVVFSDAGSGPTSNIQIGGTVAGAGNRVASNTGPGVLVVVDPGGTTTTGTRIQGNEIYNNTGLGIDLLGEGVTPNDPGDADLGPNTLQNFPVLTRAITGNAVISGTLSSQANQTYLVEFFSSPTADASGHGEGQVFLGRTAVTTDASGQASFEVTFPAPLTVGHVVTATATDSQGNTSEFALAIPVTTAGAAQQHLLVTVNGQGTGTVQSWQAGINSTVGDLTEDYPSGSLVTLQATPTGASVFLGWSDNGRVIPAVADAQGRFLLTLPLLATHNVTATFGATALEAVPAIPRAPQGTSFWANTVTFSWFPVQPPAGFDLVGYHVKVGTESGEYTHTLAVSRTTTALTLFNVPPVTHYFIVTAFFAPTGTIPLSASGLEPAAVPTASPDVYATVQNTPITTTAGTGVLANDRDTDGDVLRVRLVAGAPVVGGTVVLNLDGSFVFTPTPTFTGTASFSYEISDNNGASFTGAVPVTIVVGAQQSGASIEATGTPLTGLQGWTVLDEGNLNGPSNWNGGQSPILQQFSGIDSTEAADSLLQRGTLLFLTGGLPQQRTDYTLTFTLKSDSAGALGVLFRYTDVNNFYRFSMDRAAGYMRLVKVAGGQVVGPDGPDPDTLPDLNVPLVANQVAYTPGVTYTLTIAAESVAQGAQLTVQVRNGTTGQLEAHFTYLDTVQPLNGSGLALYSANNPAGAYNLLSTTFIGAPPPTTAALEVQSVGGVLGVVTSTPVGIATPGSPAATYAVAQTPSATLTAAVPQGGTFDGWSGAVTGSAPTIAVPLTGGQASVVTATFTGGPGPTTLSYDVNLDGVATPQDAIVILRYLSLVSGPALTAGVVTGGQRTDPAAIKAYLDDVRSAILDVNLDGLATPQDAIVILRHLSLVSGPALTAGVITGGNQTSPTAIKTYLNHYTPGAGIASATAHSAPSPATSQVSPSPQSSVLGTQDLAGLSTTASLQPLVLPSDPVQTEAISIPSTPDSQLAAALVGLDDFRGDARFATIDGDAFSTVIIDTGIDLDHPFFGPDADRNGIADRIIYQYDFADNDANASDRNGHGSNVAGIIGSQDAADRGVAPGTDLIVLKVFKDSGGGTFGDVERALQWVIDNIDTYNIGVVNMSLGDGGTWANALSLYGIGDELSALAEEDVLLVSAAGNHFSDNGSTLGVAYPGADPSVLAVGAVWVADYGGPWNFSTGASDVTTGPDRIASFSQRDAQLLDMLAPGARMTGAGPFGGRLTLQGTSQASAYMAGVASLAQDVAFDELGRRLTPNEFLSLVRRTGDQILDGDDEQDNVRNSGFTFPRVNVERLAEDILRLKNDPPVVTAETVTLTEHSAVGTVVGTVHATDPDPYTVLAYRIVAGNEAVAFAIDPRTGIITVADGAPLDFETTPQFLLTVEATDDGLPALTGRATITVNLTNINDAPSVVAAAFTVFRYSPTGTSVGQVRASDPDAGTILTYAIVDGNRGGAFAIDAATGMLHVANRRALAFCEEAEFRLMVQATDNGTPMLSSTQLVSVKVSDRPGRVRFDDVRMPFDLRVGHAIAAQQAWVRQFVAGTGVTDDIEIHLPASV